MRVALDLFPWLVRLHAVVVCALHTTQVRWTVARRAPDGLQFMSIRCNGAIDRSNACVRFRWVRVVDVDIDWSVQRTGRWQGRRENTWAVRRWVCASREEELDDLAKPTKLIRAFQRGESLDDRPACREEDDLVSFVPPECPATNRAGSYRC